ncbi:hypothetical protein B5F40_14850 [Gordonibacter sp. An230]|nr:hypothetical protein B5F40_14850 [Gordonibacter sp. An230]
MAGALRAAPGFRMLRAPVACRGRLGFAKGAVRVRGGACSKASRKRRAGARAFGPFAWRGRMFEGLAKKSGRGCEAAPGCADERAAGEGRACAGREMRGRARGARSVASAGRACAGGKMRGPGRIAPRLASCARALAARAGPDCAASACLPRLVLRVRMPAVSRRRARGRAELARPSSAAPARRTGALAVSHGERRRRERRKGLARTRGSSGVRMFRALMLILFVMLNNETVLLSNRNA